MTAARNCNDFVQRADRMIERMLDRHRLPLTRADTVFASLPTRLLAQTGRSKDQLTALSRRADVALATTLTQKKAQISAQDRVLQSLDYRKVLKRGYAIVRDEHNKPVSQAAGIALGQKLELEFADGRVQAMAGEGGPEISAASATGFDTQTKTSQICLQGGSGRIRAVCFNEAIFS